MHALHKVNSKIRFMLFRRQQCHIQPEVGSGRSQHYSRASEGPEVLARTVPRAWSTVLGQDPAAHLGSRWKAAQGPQISCCVSLSSLLS